MNNKGYLIVLKPGVNVEKYESSEYVKANQENYHKYREAFSGFNYKNYRGISRDPLDVYPPEKDLNELSKKGIDIKSNKAARIRLREIVPEVTMEFYDDSFIHKLDDAVDIYHMVDDPASWEIINIVRDEFETDKTTLGFDVGYWGGDHFSLIADIIVTPEWHAPPPEDYFEVAERLSNLNQHLLFDTPEAAADFRSYYRSKSWAETEFEKDEFCIIQINTIETTKL